MIKNEVKTISYSNGEIQRVQCVRFDNFSELDYIHPEYSRDAYDKIIKLYREYIVPSFPIIFGQLVLFHLDESFPDSICYSYSKYGDVASKTAKIAIELRRGLKIVFGKPVFLTSSAREIYNRLKSNNYIDIISGKLPHTTIIPVGSNFGLLSECDPGARLKVNSSFFTMDRFDCQSVYDELGTPIGLYAKDGVIFNPPLFSREALVVKTDGSVSVETPDLNNLIISINGNNYCKDDSKIFTRPAFRKTPFSNHRDLVIIGNKVAAIKDGGNTYVPTSGFVLSLKNADGISPGDNVVYKGMEDVSFALQVGNSIIKDGIKTLSFVSPFYNIRNLWSPSFPPSLYPLDFENARAPRIALGADIEGRPMLIWVEGHGKFGYNYGNESCGASLSEMTTICSEFGMYNAINLDGGGSAQILLNNKRSLFISDRCKEDNSEAERAIPIGLAIR